MNEMSFSFPLGNYLPSFLYIILFAIFIWYTFVMIYHLIRFGIGTKPKIFALVFFIGAVLLLIITIDAYKKITWEEMFSFIRNIIQ